MAKKSLLALRLCLAVLLLCGLVQIVWGLFIAPALSLSDKSRAQEILHLSQEAAAPLFEYIEHRARVSGVLSLVYGGVVVVLSGYGLARVGSDDRDDA